MTLPKKISMESGVESSQGETPSSVGNLLILIVVLISIALNIVVIYLLIGNTFSISANNDPLGIKKAILEVEYSKVGGQANYALLNQAQLIQFTQNLPQLKEFIQSQGGNKPQTDTKNKVLDSASLNTLKVSAAIEGDKNAKISVYEYSDMECPYCIKQYYDTKLKEKLIAQYGSGVNFIFKNNKGVNHPGTTAKAIASLCAQEVGGDTAYISYYNAIMQGSPDSRNVYPVSDLPKLARSLNLDMTKWQKCYDTSATQALFTAQTSEALSFNLGGTPGTLIVNNTTGRYDTIEGAYPFEAFTEKIDELSK